MTLLPFKPEDLDALALRFLDLAALARGMANSSRENELDGFTLHVNKVNEWLGHLEGWAIEGQAKLDTALIRQKGKRRAEALPYPASESRAEKRPAGRKKTSKK
jgi:hypothetical protein